MISILLSPLDNISQATFSYIKLLNVSVTRKGVIERMSVHPDFPSMLAICDILKEYGIENYAIRIEKEGIEELPCPFITQVRSVKNEEVFTIVNAVTKEVVEYLDTETNKWKLLAQSDFLKKFSGVVLLGEADGNSGEINYEKNRIKERRESLSNQFSIYLFPSLVIIMSFYAWWSYGSQALFPIGYIVLALVGTIVGFLLFIYEIDKHNPTLQKVCSGNKKVNCSSVLQSKASKVFGVSLSVIGLSYFAGSLIALLIGGMMSYHVLVPLSLLSIMAVPFILFSLYYQWKVTKQWCVLCLWVQSVLLLQVVVVLSSGWLSSSSVNFLNIQNVVLIIAAFSVPFILSKLLISTLQKAKGAKGIKLEFLRLKHDPEIFDALLSRQKMIQENPAGLGIILGNQEAKYKIIKVCNPYCGPCASAHPIMEEILENNPDVQLQVIFTARDDDSDMKAYPVRHLLAVAEGGDEGNTKLALDDWYNAPKKDYEIFANKHPMNGELKNQGHKIVAMREWCDKTEVSFTPMFFINGYQLPKNYSIDDLKYFLKV